MESLDAIFSSAAKAAPSESAPVQEAAVATDVKTAEPVAAEKPAIEAAAAPSAAKTPEPAKVEETAEQIAERTRNEKGQFIKADEVAALRKGLESERKQRQDERKRREELEKQIRDRDAAAAPKTDIFENPDKALDERFDPKLQRIQEAHNAEMIALYEDLARAKFSDFDAVMDEIKAEAEEDPALAQSIMAQLVSHRNKPEALYKLVVNRREMKAVGGDLSKYKDTVTAEFKTKIGTLEAENKALKAQLDNLGKVPSSLNSEPSATRAAVEKQAAEPKSLEDIFKPRKRRSA